MITITAATGRYGRLVIEALLKRGVPAGTIVAAVRSPEKAADLAAKGVQVREADYDKPETLVSAFAGSSKLLLVPSASFGQRHPQMERAIKAAVDAKVDLVAYAGFINNDTSTFVLAEEHKLIETAIKVSGLPSVMLRNGAYIEVYSGDLGNISLESGVMFGCADNGKVSGASRADFAEAAAAVLSSDGHAGKVYELAGTPFTMSDVAAAIGRYAEMPFHYQDLSFDAYRDALVNAGVPLFFAQVLADTSLAIKRGDWYRESTDLQTLIGRSSTPLVDVVAATLERNLGPKAK